MQCIRWVAILAGRACFHVPVGLPNSLDVSADVLQFSVQLMDALFDAAAFCCSRHCACMCDADPQRKQCWVPCSPCCVKSLWAYALWKRSGQVVGRWSSTQLPALVRCSPNRNLLDCHHRQFRRRCCFTAWSCSAMSTCRCSAVRLQVKCTAAIV